MLEDEDDDDEDDDDDDKDDDEVEGKFAVNVVCSSIHVSFFFFAFLVFMHSHLFLLSQWAFFQITHHLPCVYAFTSFPLFLFLFFLFFLFRRFLYYQDNMMEMQVVGRSKAEVKRKVAKQC